MLEHGVKLLEKIITAAPLLHPSTLKLSVTDGGAAPDVASAAADLLAAHSNACQADALQPSPVQQLSAQSTPAQPDVGQPKPPCNDHTHNIDQQPPLDGLASRTSAHTSQLPGEEHISTADKANRLALPVANQQALAVPEVLWQVFAYAEKAGLQLTELAVRNMWTSQAMSGAMSTYSSQPICLVCSCDLPLYSVS